MTIPSPASLISRSAALRVGALVLVCTLQACDGSRQVTESAESLLLITVDTARADRFSFTGSTAVDTAVADSLAGDGTAFLAACAPSPITLVSHASLMTSLDPPAHGVRNNGEFALASDAVTLAEILHERGWRTGAFLGAAVLDSRYGLAQGFDEYDDEMDATVGGSPFTYARRRGEEVVRAALDWLERNDSRRTFVWVHLYDPHAPYEPPEPERSLYAGRPYDGAIAYTDRVVGILLDGYRRLGRWKRTLVVLTSDHGESLGEHGESTHGVFVYDATIRVPLVVRGPGVPSGGRVTSPVRLTDVMPTILDLLGLPRPQGIAGRSLLALMSGQEAPSPRPVYVESLLPQFNYGWSPLRGLRSERWKLIEGAGRELYDLDADPAERVNLADEKPDLAARLSDELGAIAAAGDDNVSERLTIDEETRRQLAAIGYFSLERSVADSESLPDPRSRIRTLERMNTALNRFSRGDRDGAIDDLETIFGEEPDNLAASYSLGQLRLRVGDYDGAAEAYGRAAMLAPADAKYREYQGFALERAGRLEQALEAFDRALEVDPKRRGSRALRWRTLARLGRRRELVADLERALEEDPGDGIARVELLRAVHGSKASPELVAALEQASSDYPREPAIASALAHALMARGDSARAEDLYRRVLEALPADHDSSLVVGRLALERGEVEESRRILEAGVRKHPDRPAMQVAVARARLADGDLDAARLALDRAWRLDPGSADLWLVSGELALAAGELDRARSDLMRAAESRHSGQENLDRLVRALREVGLDEVAATVAERRTQ